MGDTYYKALIAFRENAGARSSYLNAFNWEPIDKKQRATCRAAGALLQEITTPKGGICPLEEELADDISIELQRLFEDNIYDERSGVWKSKHSAKKIALKASGLFAQLAARREVLGEEHKTTLKRMHSAAEGVQFDAQLRPGLVGPEKQSTKNLVRCSKIALKSFDAHI